jgi:hypothetical protein
MSTKADETFQESVQALADWITFLEGKKGVYQRQLERASAAQAPEDDNTELDAGVDAVAVIETADPEMASWDEGDQELDSWDQVESDDAEEAAVQPYDDEEMAAWDVDFDGDLDTWGDEPEAAEEPKDRKEPEEPKGSKETREPEEPKGSDVPGAIPGAACSSEDSHPDTQADVAVEPSDRFDDISAKETETVLQDEADTSLQGDEEMQKWL